MAETSKKRPDRKGGDEPPANRISQEFQNLMGALGERALSSVSGKVEGVTSRLTDYAGSGGSSLISALTGSKHPKTAIAGGMVKGLGKMAVGGLAKKLTGGGKGGQSGKLKMINIIETIDVGAPLRVVYDQWTQFGDFSSFMKKVEGVEQKSDEKLEWTAKVFWSRRVWESTILEQLPDKRIIWRSKGQKGHVDGAVTFHEIAPELTRILLVLEYYPQGLFERTGNLWRAQGRRARLELKHFRRHVMSRVLLHPDELEGWRGEIRDSEVVKDQETALREEEEREKAEKDSEEETGRPENGEAEDEEPEEEEPEEEEPEEEEPEEEDEFEEEEEEEEEPEAERAADEDEEEDEDEMEEEEPEGERAADEEEEEEEEKPPRRPSQRRSAVGPKNAKEAAPKRPARRKAASRT
ncbi:SRPBCC family protein [Streptosporangium sp. NPDC023963]|uniref:SRPBCC family protein n=1 Tax=Streptosporangium sp. NPDC023963 TaxID=3155608 RepID=UPI00343EC172